MEWKKKRVAVEAGMQIFETSRNRAISGYRVIISAPEADISFAILSNQAVARNFTT